MARKTEVICKNKFRSITEEERKEELSKKWRELLLQKEERRQVQNGWK